MKELKYILASNHNGKNTYRGIYEHSYQDAKKSNILIVKFNEKKSLLFR